jgi:guanine deaminase
MSDCATRAIPPGGPCTRLTAVRGSLVWFRGDPFTTSSRQALVHVEDGLLVCQDGKIVQAGDYAKVNPTLPAGTTVVHHRDSLILPGLIDLHVHYVQLRIMAAYGEQLMQWLRNSVYPEEERFDRRGYAARAAVLFCDELLRNGTTTALVNCTSHAVSVDVLFEESTRRGMRMAAGKVLMDRNAPPSLLDPSPQQAYEESKRLIETWHGVGRGIYAVTPRFAVACTPKMLKVAGRLWREHPGTLLQTHMAENRDEVEEVRKLFPDHRDYIDVQRSYGLLDRGAVFAHAVHLSEDEWTRLSDSGSAVAHCPTSNLFLGSGLFPMKRVKHLHRALPVGLGSDVAGGDTLSLLRTMNEAYKVSELANFPMTGVKLFYLATLGAATAMRLDGVIGSLQPGHEADFVVLDPAATPVLAHRTGESRDLEDRLFALALLGDDRAVVATYLNGEIAYQRRSCDRGGPHREAGPEPRGGLT